MSVKTSASWSVVGEPSEEDFDIVERPTSPEQSQLSITSTTNSADGCLNLPVANEHDVGFDPNATALREPSQSGTGSTTDTEEFYLHQIWTKTSVFYRPWSLKIKLVFQVMKFYQLDL
jgi:hypothetical protein